jgi:P27 family predicted phage terminase small subunit
VLCEEVSSLPKIVTFDKMAVGKKGGGKHWTKDEVDRRSAAAQKLQRKVPVRFKVPMWLDDEARQVWKKTLKDLSGLDILDKVDEEALAVYCDAVVRHREATLFIREKGYVVISGSGAETVSPYVKAAQSYARIIAQFADKLGLTPTGRARLAKKIADGPSEKELKEKDMFGD